MTSSTIAEYRAALAVRRSLEQLAIHTMGRPTYLALNPATTAARIAETHFSVADLLALAHPQWVDVRVTPIAGAPWSITFPLCTGSELPMSADATASWSSGDEQAVRNIFETVYQVSREGSAIASTDQTERLAAAAFLVAQEEHGDGITPCQVGDVITVDTPWGAYTATCTQQDWDFEGVG